MPSVVIAQHNDKSPVHRRRFRNSLAWLVANCLWITAAQGSDAQQLEFFETKIRPLLVNHCYECHSGESKKLGAGLRLDSQAAIMRGGETGAVIVPGKPEESLLIQSVRYDTNEMPPNQKLADAEIAALEQWVTWGAPWPDEVPASSSDPEQGYDWKALRKHWAWQPIERPTPPSPGDAAQIKNPIDQFVAARLHEHDLKQPAPATTAVLVRRCFIDLLGIPPSPDQLARWVTGINADPGQQDMVISQMIDELLERPQYGERWGRHWLDVARYSDIGGWSQDNRPHPEAWRYRDWVVSAFNTDMPYNDFVSRQIAGDQVDSQSAIGTGFFALGPFYSSDGGDPESIAQAKSETLDDRVDTFSRAFLGLTVACARCHDHKFDPIPTQDYYSIAGIFNNTRETETPLVDAEIQKAYHDHQRRIRETQDKVKQIQKQAADAKREATEQEKSEIKSWQDKVKELNASAPPKYDFAHTIEDFGGNDMKIALRGNLLKTGEIAPRRFLRIVEGEERQHFNEGSGRIQLAQAVVSPSNPLTARVIVNRIWMNHFGKALVRTPSNFGTLGEPPTHPELLDWLSAEFLKSDWSIKSMHRLIMNSATYRSSSDFHEQAFLADGDNRLLWRMPPRRMDVETWRDSLLAVTGELDTTLGGPSIDRIVNSQRRTLYAKVSRNEPQGSDDFLRLFDFPIPRASAAKRTSNVIPQQFLFMMNSQFMINRAKALSSQLQQQATNDEARIMLAYSLLYGRPPTHQELVIANQFLAPQATQHAATDRWQQYCQVMLSANEFMYIR
ncbi:MAG: DUF1553 domain-containing protein [Rubripirellula sp.]|nr:DUF1553 domain-containing protein [Rubripirellula sp.]